MDLSIIIPTYNTGDLLKRCLDSVILNIQRSDYKIEIIIIDDGSTDNTKSIIYNYSNKYKFVKFEFQKNGGAGKARNRGLKIASGKYIWFIDSDDWLNNVSLSDIIKIAEIHNIDIIAIGYSIVSKNSKQDFMHYKDTSFKIWDGQEFTINLQKPAGPWASIYRKEFLNFNNLSFIPGIIFEDEEFTSKAYILAKRIIYFQSIVYNYFQREGSVMKSDKSEKACFDMLAIADSLYDFKQRNDLKDSTKQWLENKIAFIISQSLAYSINNNISNVVFKNKPYYPLEFSSQLHFISKFKYKLINFSIPIYKLVYKIIKQK